MQLFYGQERRLNYVMPDNAVVALVKYMAATIALENPQHIDWKYVVKLQPNELLEYLISSRNKTMTMLSRRMHEVCRVFDFKEFPDLVVGRADANAFYDELLMVSKNNRRNSADYANYVKKPVSDLLVENNRAKL
jgi:hypothetical protein